MCTSSFSGFCKQLTTSYSNQQSRRLPVAPNLCECSAIPLLSLFLPLSLSSSPSPAPSPFRSFLPSILRANVLCLLVTSTWICASLWYIKISCLPKLKIPRAVPVFKMNEPSSSSTVAHDSDSKKNYSSQPNVNMRYTPREDCPDWWQVRKLKR